MVLDDGLIGGGMTGRTTAHLSNAYDDRYVEIEKLHGAEAIDKISEIVISEKINCDFESRFTIQRGRKSYQGPANSDLTPAE